MVTYNFFTNIKYTYKKRNKNPVYKLLSLESSRRKAHLYSKNLKKIFNKYNIKFTKEQLKYFINTATADFNLGPVYKDNYLYKIISLGPKAIPIFIKQYSSKMPKGFYYDPKLSDYTLDDYNKLPNIEYTPHALAYTLYLLITTQGALPPNIYIDNPLFDNNLTYINIARDAYFFQKEDINHLYDFLYPHYSVH